MPSRSRPPGRCPDCGAELSAVDRFCSACGARVGRASADDRKAARGATAAPEDRAWLRRRVEDLRDEGWTPVEDDGDRVVLRRRSLGRPLVHLLLLPLTGGAGNVLYALYRYTSGAPRRVVHADGVERRFPERGAGIDLPTAAGAVAGGLFVLLAAAWVGLAVLANLSTAAVAVGALAFVLLALGAALVPRFARDGVKPVTTVGRERTVERERVRTPPEPCAACGRRVVRGEHRRYADRLYLFGLPVSTSASGENVYCASCADETGRPGAGDAGADAVDAVEAELARLRGERSAETNGGSGGGQDGEGETPAERGRDRAAARESDRPGR
ncbi:zinc ribbon domain-containing protein [Halobaculum sp. EA56]|uniref:zinc ribbon domain-containing protein n=1 Tax=Halobaculum sp. EA56 TaxID=3421648 RepID=UPI003EC12E6C